MTFAFAMVESTRVYVQSNVSFGTPGHSTIRHDIARIVEAFSEHAVELPNKNCRYTPAPSASRCNLKNEHRAMCLQHTLSETPRFSLTSGLRANEKRKQISDDWHQSWS